MENNELLHAKATLVRKYCLIATTEAGSGHPTSCLSAADIATVLFDKYFTYDLKDPLNLFNDRFVLSKGHAAPLLYTLFAVSGAYQLDDLKTLRKMNSPFQGHPVPEFKYTEAATGSLGQGLSVAAGLAIISKKEKVNNKIYVLCGDGELAEGQIWEAANFSSLYKLDNLIAILDINRLAQSGETMFGHHLEKYTDRFKAFGFEIITIDGHNYTEINMALQKATTANNGKPVAIIAQTIKGKGVSFLEDKEGWHGKALNKEELKKALTELGAVDDGLRFELNKPPVWVNFPPAPVDAVNVEMEHVKPHATREIFGKAITEAAKKSVDIYVLDADVKNSTFTKDFLEIFPERFIECYIAEQNMVSVAVGLARMGKIPVVSTFGAFLQRAADQVRMARISEANIKFVGSHVGVAIGEDGPSQMALEDIAMFGAIPDTIIFQPADAQSTIKIIPHMINHKGFVYLRTLRPKTNNLYNNNEDFIIGGSKIVRSSSQDLLTVAATGITVFEALTAADKLKEENINIRVIDCYCIHPIDKETLLRSVKETKMPVIITVEDHFMHGGLGDFIIAAVADKAVKVEKLAVKKIEQSGTKEELLKDAQIDSNAIIEKTKQLLQKEKRNGL